MLHKVWNAHNATLATKLKLFNSIVVSVLIYRFESQKGLKEVENRVNRFGSGCLRKIYNIRCSNHMSEGDLRRRAGQQSVIDVIKIRRWRQYRHVLRMPLRRLPKQAISLTPTGRSRVERPEDTWRRTIAREAIEENLDQQNVITLQLRQICVEELCC